MCAGHHNAVRTQIVGLSIVCEPAGLHIRIRLVEEIPLAVKLLPACDSVEVDGSEIVLFAFIIQPSLKEVSCLRAQIIPCIFLGYPLPSGVHMTVYRIKQVFFAVNSLPAKQHDAVGIEVVSLAVNCSETGYTVSVLIKIVCLAIDLLELTRAVRAILIAVFDSAGGLDELGNICIPFRQSCGGIVRRNSCRGALHARCDDVVQSVVKLIVYGIDDLSRTVFDLDVHGIHISLAGNTDMTGLDGEGEHSVVSGAVYIAGVFEIIDRGLNPAAAERGGAVTHPVIVSKGRIHFFEKSCRITGVSAVMVEFEDVS